jgi:mycoredoxin
MTMNDSSPEKIILFSSGWCAHSRSVENFLNRNEIDVHKINIDGDDEARRRLIELNNGYASVPTLLFPDGTKLTEPSFFEIRQKLGLEQPPGLADRVRTLLNRGKD